MNQTFIRSEAVLSRSMCFSKRSGANTVPTSPVNVVDVFLVDLEYFKGDARASRLDTPDLRPMRAVARTRDSATTKDSLTMTFSTTIQDDEEENDEHSIVSSLSSHSGCQDRFEANALHVWDGDEDANEVISRGSDRRSIFLHYWKTTGQEPLELIREHSHLTRSPGTRRLSSLDAQVSQPPALTLPATKPVSSRRSIFGGADPVESYPSIRSLPELGSKSPAQTESARKTRSASCLLPTAPLPSCLRRSRAHSFSATSSSVRFNANVQVITYQKPMEHWSNGSWVKLFSIG